MPTKTFWKFKNEAESEAAELMLYGEISDVSWYGDEVTPRQFHEDLVKCEGKDLAVHINSPGGDVFAAQAIYTQLKNYAGRVTMYIDGMCASAATIIACAGDAVIMPANTIYMIHNPKSAMLGYFDAPELDKISASLGAVKQTIVNVYMARVQDALSEVQIKHKMDSEEWMTAETAKSYGFVDEIAEAIPIENRIEGNLLIVNSVSCDLGRFQNAARLREIINGKSTATDGLMSAQAQDAPNLCRRKRKGEFSMNDNEILQKIKNVLGIGGVPGTTAPQPSAPQNHAETDKAAIIAEEHQRIAALDAMKNGNPAIDAVIETAKANGATAESVKPYVDAIGQEQPTAQAVNEEKMLEKIRAILTDNADSGAAGVLPTPQGGQKNEAAQKAANIEDVANYANKLMGVN